MESQFSLTLASVYTRGREEADKEEEEEDKEDKEEDKEGNWRRRPTDGQKRRKSSWFGKKNTLGTQNDDDAALDERR